METPTSMSPESAAAQINWQCLLGKEPLEFTFLKFYKNIILCHMTKYPWCSLGKQDIQINLEMAILCMRKIKHKDNTIQSLNFKISIFTHKM